MYLGSINRLHVSLREARSDERHVGMYFLICKETKIVLLRVTNLGVSLHVNTHILLHIRDVQNLVLHKFACLHSSHRSGAMEMPSVKESERQCCTRHYFLKL